MLILVNQMINYLGRPQFGTNYTDLSRIDEPDNNYQHSSNKKGGFFSQ